MGQENEQYNEKGDRDVHGFCLVPEGFSIRGQQVDVHQEQGKGNEADICVRVEEEGNDPQFDPHEQHLSGGLLLVFFVHEQEVDVECKDHEGYYGIAEYHLHVFRGEHRVEGSHVAKGEQQQWYGREEYEMYHGKGFSR